MWFRHVCPWISIVNHTIYTCLSFGSACVSWLHVTHYIWSNILRFFFSNFMLTSVFCRRKNFHFWFFVSSIYTHFKKCNFISAHLKILMLKEIPVAPIYNQCWRWLSSYQADKPWYIYIYYIQVVIVYLFDTRTTLIQYKGATLPVDENLLLRWEDHKIILSP